MSNRVAVLSEGKLQQLAAPQEIYYGPKNQFVAQFIGKSNFFPLEVLSTEIGLTGRIADQAFRVNGKCEAGAARLCMRYETISISSDETASSDPIKLAGIVSDVLFLGSSIEVKTICAGQEVIAVLPSSRDIPFRSSQQVIVSFDPAKGHLFNV
jgi:ABC-type Fe3+/spermidine/putrescine transport system ATPase subunit